MSDLLQVDDVNVVFRTRRAFSWRTFHAVRGISLRIAAGETLGVVGESGSGKSTLGRAILGLTKVGSGRIVYDGREIQNLSTSARRKMSSEIQVVFQDPYSSLNPALTIEQILAQPLVAAGRSMRDARDRVAMLLDRVELPADAMERLPREFSGGQRQRVAIARALALEPRLVVCDEPVSGLDLRTQRAVIELLIELQEETGTALMFISHDLDVVRDISHRVAVLHQGRVVEEGTTRQIIEDPQDAYTRRLLLSAPIADPVKQAERRAERVRMFAAAEGI